MIPADKIVVGIIKRATRIAEEKMSDNATNEIS